MMNRMLCVAALVLLPSCSQGGVPAPIETSIEIAPSDFALIPCSEMERCALAVAGGKRILLGVPTGASDALAAEDLASLDRIVLFSLAADALQGLDEVRNASWHAGRRAPLIVSGPQGTEQIVAAINKTFETADALHVVEAGLPPGGYDAALLIGQDGGAAGGLLFDTGDVRISGSSDWSLGLPGTLSFSYGEAVTLHFGACDRGLIEEPDQIFMGCSETRQDLVWPLQETVFVWSEASAK